MPAVSKQQWKINYPIVYVIYMFVRIQTFTRKHVQLLQGTGCSQIYRMNFYFGLSVLFFTPFLCVGDAGEKRNAEVLLFVCEDNGSMCCCLQTVKQKNRSQWRCSWLVFPCHSIPPSARPPPLFPWCFFLLISPLTIKHLHSFPLLFQTGQKKKKQQLMSHSSNRQLTPKTFDLVLPWESI